MAKKIAIKCLGTEIKEYLLELVTDNNTREIINAIPTCLANQIIEFDFRKGKKVSEYSKFIGKCIKDVRSERDIKVPQAMKECAKIWKEKNFKKNT